MKGMVNEFRRVAGRGGEQVVYQVRCRAAADGDLPTHTVAAAANAKAHDWREATEAELATVKVEVL